MNQNLGIHIEQTAIGLLTPYAKNARTHSERQIREIARSIKKFGVISPLFVDENNEIIAGHGRLEAARTLGYSSVPTIKLTHLSGENKRALRIADNRIAEKAQWDKAALAIELREILDISIDFDITVTGFDTAEVDLLINDAAHAKDVDDEIVAEKSEPTITLPGDVWLLGRHRILCGNALEPNSYGYLMEGTLADMSFCDVPYNVKISGHVCGKGRVKHREFVMASGEMSDSEYLSFLTDACGLLSRNSRNGSLHYWCCDWRHVNPLTEAGQSTFDTLLNICVWVKDCAGMGSLYRSQHELICVFRKSSTPHQNNIQLGRFGRNRTNVWNYPSPSAFARSSEEGTLSALHPTVKPVAMVADAILDSSERGNVVVDAFLGSGTSLIAAERVGRVCYGIELDPNYVDVAIRRWQRHTGEHAIHAKTGKTFDERASAVKATNG